MEGLEGQKQIHKEDDAVVNEIVASTHIESYAMKLVLYADRCGGVLCIYSLFLYSTPPSVYIYFV